MSKFQSLQLSQQIYFVLGILAALILGMGLKLLIGIKSKLYLIGQEHGQNQLSIIPLSAELRKRTLWNTIARKHWREDLEVTLSGNSDQTFQFHMNYHLVKGFSLLLKKNSGSSTSTAVAKLDSSPITPGKAYFLKSGKILDIDGRSFIVLITSSSLENMMHSQEYSELF